MTATKKFEWNGRAYRLDIEDVALLTAARAKADAAADEAAVALAAFKADRTLIDAYMAADGRRQFAWRDYVDLAQRLTAYQHGEQIRRERRAIDAIDR